MAAPVGCSADQYAALLAAFNNNATTASALCGALNPNGLAGDISALSDRADSMVERADIISLGLNTTFLLFASALVFIMHAGFAMLCAGAVRSKNTMNILLMTVLDAAVSAVSFYVLGYGFAYGASSSPNGFIGNALFGMDDWTVNSLRWTDWFFQWAFAATATTIPAGAVAERFNFNAYLIYSCFISAFVYPVVAHWVWSSNGWLCYLKSSNPLFGSGMIDFAGSAVVHMVGGLSGLAGCIMVGPRLGRFDSNGKPCDMPGHSATLVVLGTLFLWFGWYGFNPGSTLTIDNTGYAFTSGRAAVTTTLSGASGCITALLITFIRHRAWDLLSVCNGALVGFVSITAGAHVVEPWAALIAGGVGALIFDFACIGLLKLRIDDPLSASPMHGIVGMWAVFFVGLLAEPTYVLQAYGERDPSLGARADAYGAFYRGGGHLLAAQIIGIISIAAWTLGLMLPLFYLLKRLNIIRIAVEEEHAGLDISKHGGSAYNMHDTNLGARKPERAHVTLEQGAI